jgi:hypothetical protein
MHGSGVEFARAHLASWEEIFVLGSRDSGTEFVEGLRCESPRGDWVE